MFGRGQVALEACSIDIFHGQRMRKGKGNSQAHSAKVPDIKQVNSVYATLLSSFDEGAVAMRSTAAYRFWDDTTEEYIRDNDDNFGSGAGSKLAKFLETRNENGMFILVQQWHNDADRPYTGREREVYSAAKFVLEAMENSAKAT
eukprot:TRINITY_DN27582_c0_g1_i1.p1 TRINITY_DN27582_c0_g1~~TRINITY_DN27582_c0_g1_i1.p1  ORF type:complete len:145 (+),score=34.77 TRINITY_DN27582_c0_g1_i1:436-870(+)